CVVGFGIALCCLAAAWAWLLVASGGGENRPSDAAIYAAMAVASLWLPLWGGWTLLAWVRDGQTPGLAAMALRGADRAGRAPGRFRALLRLALLGLAAAALGCVLVLLIGAAAAVRQGTLPPIIGVGVAVVLTLALADPLFCLLSAEHRALHDLAAGTLVVRAG